MPPKKLTGKSSKENSGKAEEKPKNAAAVLALRRLEEVRLLEEKQKRLEEEETLRIKLEEEEEQRIKKEKEDAAELKRKKKYDKKQASIKNGTYMTKKEKEKERRRLEGMSRGYVTTSSRKEVIEDEEDEEEEEENTKRSVIGSIMGHVDTGKTTLLDKIRNTNIQGKEVAGITQQIGASFLDTNTILGHSSEIPGILMIDTPGHSAFVSLRKRGLELCDVVVIVVDIMHGIEQNTIEVINLCIGNGIEEHKNVPFILAYNKIDLLNTWKSTEGNYLEKLQSNEVRQHYEEKVNEINQYFYSRQLTPIRFDQFNNDPDTVMFVPVSARSGEGIRELLQSILTYSEMNLEEDLELTDEFEASIMEVRKNSSGETSLDVIVKNGKLSEGDFIGISTLNGGVVTKVKSLLLPGRNQEMRMTNTYDSVKSVTGACGVKILARGIDGTIPGIPLFRLEDKNQEFEQFESLIPLDSDGVYVFAPSIGQLEGLVFHLRNETTPPVQIAFAGIGDPVKNNMVALVGSYDTRRISEKNVLCFSCEPNTEAREYGSDNGVRFFSDETVYRLSRKYIEATEEARRLEQERIEREAILPFELEILNDVFRRRDPVIIAVSVLCGRIHKNSILVDSKGNSIGKILDIQLNGVSVQTSESGTQVAISIESEINYGTENFKPKKLLYPKISRASLDILKVHFRDYITPEIMAAIRKMKKAQSIE